MTRRFWVAVHRYLGLATLVFLTLAAATGCLLCVRGPLDAALNPDLFRTSEAGAPMDAVTRVERFEAADPGATALYFPLRAPPGRTLPVKVSPRPGATPAWGEVFLDSRGRLVGGRSGRPSWGRRGLMQGVYVFHYTLLAGTLGRWLMGAMAGAWLIMLWVGLYLTLPRRAPFLARWARAWTIRLPARLPRLMLQAHEAIGLWLMIALSVLAFTSVAMNFFDEATSPAAQALSPARPSPYDHPAPTVAGARRVDFAKALASARAWARGRRLAWIAASIDYRPDRNLYGVSFTRDGVVEYRGLGPIACLVDGASGRVVAEDNPYEDSAGRRFTRALYPLHTGEIIGPPGIALDFVLGLGTVILCVTGGWLWWARRRPRLAAEHAAAAMAAAKAPRLAVD